MVTTSLKYSDALLISCRLTTSSALVLSVEEKALALDAVIEVDNGDLAKGNYVDASVNWLNRLSEKDSTITEY